jgi:uncharacterized membrane protein
LGSTILSISEIPLEIGSVDGKTFLSLIAGNIAVSYILGTVGTKDHAQAMLKDAESTISEIMSKGIKVESALNLLNQAKSAFNTSDYAKAEQLSSSAKLTATNIESQANTAIQSINRASTAISTAKNEGRTSGLSNAENLLKEAQAAYASGSYSSASLTAGRAYDAALASKNEGIDPLQVLIVVGVVALLVIGFILLKRKPKPTPQKPIEFVPEPPVNLELIFSGNPELRMDDREVIRFLADNKGEAFANEIRDRFGIPRTSAWRMIHRLIKMGIVEEKKIGGQSLIRVIKKWRRST